MNIIAVSICACILTQLIKVMIILVQKKRFYPRAFLNTGGMPSTHSAIVSALAISVAMVEGLSSVTFGISAVLAFVVMFDAAGLRRSVGKQAVILNQVVKELKEQGSAIDFEENSRDIMGHTIVQVIVGALIGAAVSCLWFTLLA
jgi:acid phosphatase family membrane protein YuiD